MKSVHLVKSSLVLCAVVAGAGFAACAGDLGGDGNPESTSAATGVPTTQGAGGTAAQGPGSGPGAQTVQGSGTGSGASAASGSGGTGQAIMPGGPGALPPLPGAALTPESAGTLLMRRVVNSEYDNIMAHLVGDTTQPALTFPSDGTVLANAPDSVADLNVQLYYQTAQVLVANALKNPNAAGNLLKLPAGCTNPTAEAAQTSCATQFITSFGLNAFRRPVAPEEQMDLLTVFSTGIGLGLSFSDSIGYVAQAMLQSPNFIYHWEIGPTAPAIDPSTGLAALTPWQVASRLSLMFWNDMPDGELLTAAQNNALSTPDQIGAQVTRMVADPKLSQGLFDFHLQWLLEVAGNVTDLAGTVHSSPAFTPAVAQSIGTEFTDFLSSVYSASGDGTFKTLMTAPYTFVNPALASVYGVTAPGAGFNRVDLDPAERAGVLTQLAFLGAQADVSADNPVRRGLAIYENMLCGTVGAPPANVPPLPSTVPAMTTTRQRFEAHASSQCATMCHTLFDPPGFAFENYDAIGTFRTLDNGAPVDAAGSFVTPGGVTLTFTNAVDLATQLASSTEAQWCTDRNWMRYVLGRQETAAELGSLQLAYRAGTATPGFSLRSMLTSLVTSKAFLYRAPSAGEML